MSNNGSAVCEEIVGPHADQEQRNNARRNGVTATDIAIIDGTAPWGSRFHLWWQKKGLTMDIAPSEVMYWGSQLEPVILKEFSKTHPDLTVMKAGVWRNLRPGQDWMIASPDGLVHSNDGEPVGVLEVKTTRTWQQWGPEGTDLIPAYYRAQVMWQMHVCNVPTARVAVLCGGSSYREYQLCYDPVEAERLIAAGRDFWDSVILGHQPDVDASPATAETLTMIYPDPEGDTDLDPSLVTRWHEARQRRKQAEQTVKQMDNEVRRALGAASLGRVGGEPLVKRVRYDRSTLDKAGLMMHLPDIYQRFTRTGSVDSLLDLTPTDQTGAAR